MREQLCLNECQRFEACMFESVNKGMQHSSLGKSMKGVVIIIQFLFG